MRYIVPLTLVIIFGLLLLTFKSFTDALIIMLSLPFAFVGGVFLQSWLGYSMTTAVIIGYIALFAVATQTGMISWTIYVLILIPCLFAIGDDLRHVTRR